MIPTALAWLGLRRRSDCRLIRSCSHSRHKRNVLFPHWPTPNHQSKERGTTEIHRIPNRGKNHSKINRPLEHIEIQSAPSSDPHRYVSLRKFFRARLNFFFFKTTTCRISSYSLRFIDSVIRTLASPRSTPVSWRTSVRCKHWIWRRYDKCYDRRICLKLGPIKGTLSPVGLVWFLTLS